MSAPTAVDKGPSVIQVLSCVLARLVAANDQKIAGRPPPMTKFHALRAPDISIHAYLKRIRKFAACSSECFVLSLVYIDRLIRGNRFLLTSLNVHRVIITSVMLAAKFFDDEYFKNGYYAQVGGVPCPEMNSLELEFLFSVNFSLHVRPEDFAKYEYELKKHVLTSTGCDCGRLAPHADALFSTCTAQQRLQQERRRAAAAVAAAAPPPPVPAPPAAATGTGAAPPPVPDASSGAGAGGGMPHSAWRAYATPEGPEEEVPSDDEEGDVAMGQRVGGAPAAAGPRGGYLAGSRPGAAAAAPAVDAWGRAVGPSTHATTHRDGLGAYAPRDHVGAGASVAASYAAAGFGPMSAEHRGAAAAAATAPAAARPWDTGAGRRAGAAAGTAGSGDAAGGRGHDRRAGHAPHAQRQAARSGRSAASASVPVMG